MLVKDINDAVQASKLCRAKLINNKKKEREYLAVILAGTIVCRSICKLK